MRIRSPIGVRSPFKRQSAFYWKGGKNRKSVKRRKNGKSPADSGGPAISDELRELREEVIKTHHTVHKVGKAIKEVHSNTTPHLSWLPSAVIAFLLVYMLIPLIEDTSRDYRVSAWMAGGIIKARAWTATQGLRWGIEFAGGSLDWVNPLEGKLVVTRGFSETPVVHPVDGIAKPHFGTDYRCKEGDSVFAMRSGTVVSADFRGRAGNMIIIQHSDGFKSVYMHLSELDVGFGSSVSTGEKIGECGATGKRPDGSPSVTGPHLHVEIIRPDGKRIDPVTVIGITVAMDMWDFFKNTVAQSESHGSGNYSAVSRSRLYYGRYQMGRAALIVAGYGNVRWDTFLNSEKMQEEAYRRWQKINLRLARSGSVRLKLPAFITDQTPAYQVAGFLHASQFGVGNALRWYAKGKDFKDGNGVLISEYARRGEEAFIAKYGRFASGIALLKSIER